MALSPIQNEPRQKGGGKGFFAKVAGGAAGLIAAPFTGGASLAAGPAVGAIADAVDSPKVSGGKTVSTLDTASRVDPSVQLAQLVDTQKQINSTGLLNEQQRNEALGFVNPAIEALRKRVG